MNAEVGGERKSGQTALIGVSYHLRSSLDVERATCFSSGQSSSGGDRKVGVPVTRSAFAWARGASVYKT